MASLISFEQAIAQLRVSGASDEDDILLKMEQASEIIRTRITSSLRDEDDKAVAEDWTEDTVPPGVKAAILVQLGELYRRRGDDDPVRETPQDRGHLSPNVERFIAPWIDPPLS